MQPTSSLNTRIPSEMRPTLAMLSVLGIGLTWSYWPTLAGLAAQWHRDPTYSHGFLVPFVAAALIWHRRSIRVRSDESQPILGMTLIIGSVAMRLFGARFYFEWLEWFSLLPCVAGICLLFGGALAWRRAWPGMLFLVFMLPLPYTLEVALAGPLQAIATSASTYLLQTFGFPAVAEGNVIVVGEVRVGVAEACSGLRMLVAFFAVSTAAACVVQRSAWERALIVPSAVPIAIVCNVARVTGTAMVYETVGSEIAHHLFHDLAGWLMMPMAVGLLIAELWLLSRLLIAPPEREVVPVGATRASVRWATTNELTALKPRQWLKTEANSESTPNGALAPPERTLIEAHPAGLRRSALPVEFRQLSDISPS